MENKEFIVFIEDSMIKHKKINELGRTMLETILVLSVISVIAISLMSAVNGAYKKYKISKVIQQVSEIRKRISARYLAVGSYSGITNQALIDDKVVPTEMVSGGKFYHAFGGEMKISGTNAYYVLTITNLPKVVCTDLATMDWRVDETTTLVSIAVAGTTGASGTTYGWSQTAAQNTLPLQINEAMAKCSTENTNKLVLTFE
ncbi:MAG: type 4 pilus major pilin [Alphaproteobacteria bacterium]